MNKILLLFPLIAFNACSPKATNCKGVQTNQYGEAIQWRRLPIQIHINNNFPTQLRAGIYKAVDTWERATGMSLFSIEEGETFRIAADSINVITFLTSYKRSSNEEGNTSIAWRGDEIVDADILINGETYSYYVDQSDKQSNKLNIEALMLHELGHLLGLEHSKEEASVMSPTLAFGADRITLSDLDTINIRCLY